MTASDGGTPTYSLSAYSDGFQNSETSKSPKTFAIQTSTIERRWLLKMRFWDQSLRCRPERTGPGIAQDHRGGLLGDHQRRRVRVARGDRRHDGRIGDAQARHPPHLETGVHHGGVVAAHFAG